jgi:hypothetical protein
LRHWLGAKETIFIMKNARRNILLIKRRQGTKPATDMKKKFIMLNLKRSVLRAKLKIQKLADVSKSRQKKAGVYIGERKEHKT